MRTRKRRDRRPSLDLLSSDGDSAALERDSISRSLCQRVTGDRRDHRHAGNVTVSGAWPLPLHDGTGVMADERGRQRRREELQARVRALRAELFDAEEELARSADEGAHDGRGTAESNLPLSLVEYRRYGRQMILPGVGLPGERVSAEVSDSPCIDAVSTLLRSTNAVEGSEDPRCRRRRARMPCDAVPRWRWRR